MKTNALFILFALIICAGCSTRYDITLSNGTVISAKGRPHYDKANSVWVYKDGEGKTSIVPSGSVTEVSPQSMDSQPATQFNPMVKK